MGDDGGDVCDDIDCGGVHANDGGVAGGVVRVSEKGMGFSSSFLVGIDYCTPLPTQPPPIHTLTHTPPPA